MALYRCQHRMSTLVFVRHGQASLFSDDYDQLSETGEQQAQELGRYFERKRVGFDELYIGPRQRHRETVALANRCCRSLPAPEEMREFDEHHVDQLVSRHLGELSRHFPYLRDLRDSFQNAHTAIDRRRAFARLFMSVSILWVNDACPLFGVESWAEFKQRVSTGIDRVLSRGGSHRRVMVATSAGTIVAALHRALRCPDEIALGLGWRVWNCSLTAFEFTEDLFTLDQFNIMSHLEDRKLWTYR